MKAPGIATRTIFFPSQISFVDTGVGLPSTNVKNVNSGTLSPSLIVVIFFFPCIFDDWSVNSEKLKKKTGKIITPQKTEKMKEIRR